MLCAFLVRLRSYTTVSDRLFDESNKPSVIALSPCEYVGHPVRNVGFAEAAVRTSMFGLTKLPVGLMNLLNV